MRKMNAHDASGVHENRCAATVSAVLPCLIDKYIAEGGNVAGQG
jgi:hypothetical protein